MKQNQEALKAFAEEYMKNNPRVEAPVQKRQYGIPVHYNHGIEAVDMSKVRKLGRNEYEDIKKLQGGMQLIRAAEGSLEDRIRELGLWPRFRSAQKMLRNICREVMYTVDPRKRNQMQIELEYSDIHIEIHKADRTDDAVKGFGYFPAKAVQDLITLSCSEICQYCMKEGAEIGGCRIRECLEALQTRDIELKAGGCPFSGLNINLAIEPDEE